MLRFLRERVEWHLPAPCSLPQACFAWWRLLCSVADGACRYGPAISTLEHIDGFCADLIAEKREAMSALVLGRTRAGNPDAAQQEASAGMLKSLQYVRAIVARNLPPHLIRSSVRQGDMASSLARAATATPHTGGLPPTPGAASSAARTPGRLPSLQVPALQNLPSHPGLPCSGAQPYKGSHGSCPATAGQGCCSLVTSEKEEWDAGLAGCRWMRQDLGQQRGARRRP